MKANLKLKVLLSAVVVLYVMMSKMASAATYNFYFNNTEQGDNSTAAPKVVVSDDKGNSPKPEPSPTPTPVAPAAEVPPATIPAAQPASGGVSTAPAMPVSDSLENRSLRYRFTTSFFERKAAKQYFSDSDYSTDGRTYESLGVQLAFYLGSQVALNFFLGGHDEDSGSTVAGLELEWNPIQISLGRFRDLVEIGGILGTGTVHGNGSGEVAPHTGLRLGLNLGEKWGIQASTRISKGSALSELGLTIRI